MLAECASVPGPNFAFAIGVSRQLPQEKRDMPLSRTISILPWMRRACCLLLSSNFSQQLQRPPEQQISLWVDGRGNHDHQEVTSLLVVPSPQVILKGGCGIAGRGGNTG